MVSVFEWKLLSTTIIINSNVFFIDNFNFQTWFKEKLRALAKYPKVLVRSIRA